jgi:O-antigen ligase
MALGLGRIGVKATARDIVFGMATFPVLMMIGYLPFAIASGQVSESLEGVKRFAIGQSDVINSARVLASGAIAALAVFSLPKRRWNPSSQLAPLAAIGLFALVVLTGNRQYFLASASALLATALYVTRLRKERPLLVLVIVAILAVVGRRVVTETDLPIAARFGSENVELEISDYRGVIWADAFKAMMESPLVGTGFKNFGEEIPSVNRSGQVIWLRDSAHGAWQDVFVEHGVLLGVMFLVGSLRVIKESFMAVWYSRRATPDNVLIVVLLALIVPLAFSSVFLNATPLFILLGVAMARCAENGPALQESRAFSTTSTNKQ